MLSKNRLSFHAVQELTDEFLALFPHRYDYIWAEHSVPGVVVEWRTESRHPLGDRLIRQGSYLYGVRFGAETNYCLLDIDTGSPYHPRQDPLAISRIVAALEPLGLVQFLACTSSYSGGLHLYLPFQQSQCSWQLAIALATLLENAGFKPHPGHLELFPNPKPYVVDRAPTLFNAHRLPLQTGSYLLDEEFHPIWSDPATFVAQWKGAQHRNDLTCVALKQVLKQVRRRNFRISGKAEKFINDLNAEIELGWTGHGQTNRLLGRITLREYIFRHVLSGGQPLVGLDLVKAIVEVAQSLPGYREWCRHQHEITQRVEEWVRCIENSHYFPYGDASGKFKAKLEAGTVSSVVDEIVDTLPTWNQRQSEGARERIRRAIADLLEKGTLPVRATQRFHCLLGYGIGGGSLYRHRDLWHPDYLMTESEAVEIPPHPPTHLETRPLMGEGVALNGHSYSSLLPGSGGNPLLQADLAVGGTFQPGSPGCNSVAAPVEVPSGNRGQGTDWVRQALSQEQGEQAARREAAQTALLQQRRIQREASMKRQVDRMQRFLESGDPILMAEALAWAQVNPGILNYPQLLPLAPGWANQPLFQ